jgi:hypothetical protein
MLNYTETNWRSQEGFGTRSYQVAFSEVKTQVTLGEQKERDERLSLVKIFNNKKTLLFDICSRFQEDNRYFYFHRNKRFHTTLLGFPVIKNEYYDNIKEKINEYCDKTTAEKMRLKFDVIRLGTKYENHNNLNAVHGLSNGTVIAVGDTTTNTKFITFGNNLCSFLLKDDKLRRILGMNFRRKFPTVWCTIGHYTKDFKITNKLETLFENYRYLEKDFDIPCYELELGSSHYKDLRDWNSIQKFSLA